MFSYLYWHQVVFESQKSVSEITSLIFALNPSDQIQIYEQLKRGLMEKNITGVL